jgi:hypothetical protein
MLTLEESAILAKANGYKKQIEKSLEPAASK